MILPLGIYHRGDPTIDLSLEFYYITAIIIRALVITCIRHCTHPVSTVDLLALLFSATMDYESMTDEMSQNLPLISVPLGLLTSLLTIATVAGNLATLLTLSRCSSFSPPQKILLSALSIASFLNGVFHLVSFGWSPSYLDVDLCIILYIVCIG